MRVFFFLFWWDQCAMTQMITENHSYFFLLQNFMKLQWHAKTMATTLEGPFLCTDCKQVFPIYFRSKSMSPFKISLKNWAEPCLTLPAAIWIAAAALLQWREYWAIHARPSVLWHWEIHWPNSPLWARAKRQYRSEVSQRRYHVWMGLSSAFHFPPVQPLTTHCA